MKARAQRRVRKRSADIIPPNPILKRNADAIRVLGRQSFENIVEIGRLPVECREILKQQGAWLAWLKAEFSWSRRSADRFIVIFEAESTGHVRNLRTWSRSLPISAFYALAKASPEVVAEIERRVASGERVKTREITISIRRIETPTPTPHDLVLTRASEPTPEPPQPDLRASTWLCELAAFAADLRHRPSPDELSVALSAEQRIEAIEAARAIVEYFSTLLRGTAGAKPKLVASNPSDDENGGHSDVG